MKYSSFASGRNHGNTSHTYLPTYTHGYHQQNLTGMAKGGSVACSQKLAIVKTNNLSPGSLSVLLTKKRRAWGATRNQPHLSNSSSSILPGVLVSPVFSCGDLVEEGWPTGLLSPIDAWGVLYLEKKSWCALFGKFTMAWEEPSPQRHTDPSLGLLSKVFIVYPHNPQVYQWVPPTPLEELQRRYPGYSPDELRKVQIAEVKKREEEERERIERHDKLVYHFAQFLESHKIAVAYEGLLLDYPTDNYMKWFQKQMKDSDYVILIITESFCHFLSNDAPPDKERIFVGNFLHSFVHDPSRHILPVFLNTPLNSALLPDALKASSTYHVVANKEIPYFNVQQPQLDCLYAVLTKQNRVAPPAAIGVVPVVGIQRRSKHRYYMYVYYL